MDNKQIYGLWEYYSIIYYMDNFHSKASIFQIRSNKNVKEDLKYLKDIKLEESKIKKNKVYFVTSSKGYFRYNLLKESLLHRL